MILWYEEDFVLPPNQHKICVSQSEAGVVGR